MMQVLSLYSQGGTVERGYQNIYSKQKDISHKSTELERTRRKKLISFDTQVPRNYAEALKKEWR